MLKELSFCAITNANTQERYQIKVTHPTLALSPHRAGERELTAKECILLWKVGPSKDKESRQWGEGGQERQPKGWCCL